MKGDKRGEKKKEWRKQRGEMKSEKVQRGVKGRDEERRKDD